MKKIFYTLLLIISFNAFSATIIDCQVDANHLEKNVVVVNDEASKIIQTIVDSKSSDVDKRNILERILFIETVSIGDNKRFCDLAISTYKIDNEKCLRVMKSSDVIDIVLDKSEDLKNLSSACRIGVTAKLLMNFKM